MPTNIQAFSVLSSGAFNGASSGASFAFGFAAQRIELYNLGTVALFAKLGTTGLASSGDLCITSCVSGLPNAMLIDLGVGRTADQVSLFSTSTAAGATQFVINALR
jgi:hypothetical protein